MDERKRLRKVDIELSSVVRSFPIDFVSTYLELFDRSLRTVGSAGGDGVSVAGARRVTRTSTNQTETRGGAKGSRSSGGSDPLRSEAALAFKSKVDRKLRKITREMKVWLEGKATQEGLRRCTVCRTFGEPSWLYCPRDGKPMESL